MLRMKANSWQLEFEELRALSKSDRATEATRVD